VRTELRYRWEWQVEAPQFVVRSCLRVGDSRLGAMRVWKDRAVDRPVQLPDRRFSTLLPRDSVVNVMALVTLGRADLSERVSQIPHHLLLEVDRGLRPVLDL